MNTPSIGGPGERQLAQGPISKHYTQQDIAAGMLAAILSSSLGAFQAPSGVRPDSELRGVGCAVYRQIQRNWRGEVA